MVVLYLKEGPHKTPFKLNITMVKKMKKKKEKEKKKHFAIARNITHEPCQWSQALYPLDHGAIKTLLRKF